MSMKILRGGMLTSIQDLGRLGYQKYGIIGSGVMDEWSARMANILVENDENEGVLELTMFGPQIEFLEDTLIALTGGDLQAMIEDKEVPLWRPVYIKKGSVLSFGFAVSGCRAYLAVSSGFDIPLIIGSKSTYLRAGLGGFKGRALKEGDELFLGSKHTAFKDFAAKNISESFWAPTWSLPHPVWPSGDESVEIRVTSGAQMKLFTSESIHAFFNQNFTITADSDRMGYRLQGDRLSLIAKEDMISEAISFGSIQVPSEGNPIILLADRQTAGGYPKIAQVCSVDLSLIAQLKPDFQLSFRLISHNEAEALFLMRETDLLQQKYSVSFVQSESLVKRT